MPDSLSIAADSILADSLARVAAVEDSLRKCIHADYSLLDSLLEKNVASAHGIYPAPKPYDATTDDGIVIAFLMTFVLIVVFLVQMRISRQAINKNLSTRLLDTPPAQLPSTLGGFFCLTAGISLGIGLVWVARSLNVALPSPFSQMGSLELSLIAGLIAGAIAGMLAGTGAALLALGAAYLGVLSLQSKVAERDLVKVIVKRSYPALYRVRPKHIRNLWRGFNLSPRREGASRG